MITLKLPTLADLKRQPSIVSPASRLANLSSLNCKAGSPITLTSNRVAAPTRSLTRQIGAELSPDRRTQLWQKYVQGGDMIHAYDDVTALLLRSGMRNEPVAQAVFRKRDNRLLYHVHPGERPDNWFAMKDGYGYGWLGIHCRPDDILVIAISRFETAFFCHVFEAEGTSLKHVSQHRNLPEPYRVPQLVSWEQGCLPGLGVPSLEEQEHQAEHVHNVHLQSMEKLRKREADFARWRQATLLSWIHKPADKRKELNPGISIYMENLAANLQGALESMTDLERLRRREQLDDAMRPAEPMEFSGVDSYYIDKVADTWGLSKKELLLKALRESVEEAALVTV